MQKLLIPTQNQEKFQKIKKMIIDKYPQMQVLSLNDIKLDKFPEYDQKKDDIIENTKNKAQAYANLTNIPTLIFESALYLDALKPEEQPGTNIKKWAGEKATDEEILNSYLEKIKKIPEHARTCRWLYAMCLAIPQEGEICDSVELSEEFTDKPYLPIEKGYPLKSILFDPLKQKTHREYTEEEYKKRNKPILEKLYTIMEDLNFV